MSQTISSVESRRDAMPGLKGKNVLVTGGSSGIGQAIAVRFAEYGANVAINYLKRPEEAHDTEEQLHACVHRVRQEGVQDVLVGGDVSNEDDVVRMVGEAANALGGIDVLVNNASGFGMGDDEAGWQKGLAVDVMAMVRASHAALPMLEASGEGASIIHIPSISGFRASTRTPAYAAVKAAMISYTDNRAATQTMAALVPMLMMMGHNTDPQAMSAVTTMMSQMGQLSQYMGTKGATMSAEPTRITLHGYSTSGAEGLISLMGLTSIMSTRMQQSQTQPGLVAPQQQYGTPPPAQPQYGAPPAQQPAALTPAPTP